MNNANFGYDCRINANNSIFEPIIEEVNEISHIKKYHSLFDSKVSNNVNNDFLGKEFKQNFHQKMANRKNDNTFENANTSLKNKKSDNMDSLEYMKRDEKKKKKERKEKKKENAQRISV